VRYAEEYIRVDSGVALRVVSFMPPFESPFPSIVFVPGWISLISAWHEVLRELTKDFRVIYVETREKITSRVKGDAGFGVEDIAEEIAAAVSIMKCRSNGFVLLGSSLGATAVIESCRFLRQEPHCLVLVSPNTEFRIPPPGLFIIRMMPPSSYRIIKPIIKWYLRTFRLNVEADYPQYAKYCNSLDAAVPWKLKKAAIAFSRYQIWKVLRSVRVPVLVFGASRDALHGPENLERMLERLARVTMIDLETNKRTHSGEMVHHLRRYLKRYVKGEGI
jgi:pimeloyl-ACP methyl ester carboxylesterase